MTSIFDYFNPYAYAMRVRRRLYERDILRSEHPGVSVISIGNLSVGGTGKSPMVLHLAKHIIEQRKRVAIVSRGYRRKSKGFVLVRDGSQILAKVEETGDEAQMLAQELPEAIVIVSEDRVHGAREAKRLGAQVVILDDAFQHLRVQRDLNILLIDAERPLSAVIPFGRFREPFSAARAADAIVFTNASDKNRLRNQWELLKPYTSDRVTVAAVQAVPKRLASMLTSEQQSTDYLAHKRVLALSSIASPKRFHRMLESLGADLTVRDLGDHAGYSETLVRAIMLDAERSSLDCIVTTAKDAVKSRKHFEHLTPTIPIFILEQELEFLSGERSLVAAIDRII